jgi:hydrogenase-4 component B
MLDIFTSQISFIFLICLFLIGAMGAIFLQKDDVSANNWGSFWAIVGSSWGLLLAMATLVTGREFNLAIKSPSFPLLSLSVNIDLLAAFFIFVICLVALFSSIYGMGYVEHYYKKYNIGALGFFYNLFIAGMLMVVTAANGIFFLIAWEIMSVASYFLVVFDRHDEKNVKSGFLYLVMTHAGTAFIIFSFLLLYQYTGSFDFQAIKIGIPLIPLAIKNIIFVLAMIGFGTKAGTIPFHIWLPAAHPAAPSHVSALMSGVMIKTGIYMMVRIFVDLLWPVPTWWGLTILILGGISAVLGVLYALAEHDIKKLLAYHSIENIGIILLGLGASLTFSSLGMSELALLSLTAALFHTMNHAIFKSLLFLGAGSVINQTHTRNMEELGGLIKNMPLTAVFFLIGSMAISALPPFNGFFSEWLTYQSLFRGVATLGFYPKWIFVFGTGSLALTGGLAAACFVKAFGITFLARPRSSEAVKAKESKFTMVLGMGSLAVFSLLFGVFSNYVTIFIQKIGNSFSAFQNVLPPVLLTPSQGMAILDNFSSVSGLGYLMAFSAITGLVVLITREISKNQKVELGRTWDCGVNLTPRMEITATGFARSIILIFKKILRPSIQHEIEYLDVNNKYVPKTTTVTLSVHNVYLAYFYEPIQRVMAEISSRAKRIQSGNINAYILYIFIALAVALLLTK